EREKPAWNGRIPRRLAAFGDRPAQEAPFLAIPSGQSRERGGNGESLGGTREDPADEGLDEAIRDLASQAACEEGVNALLPARATAREELAPEANLPARRKKARPAQADRGHSQHMHTTAPSHVPGAPRTAGQNYLSAPAHHD